MSTKVSESSGYGPNTQMSLFGYIMAAILVIILIPLIPVLVPVWILWKVFVAEDEFEHSFETWRRETGHNGSREAKEADTEPADADEGDATETDAENADQAEADQTAAES
ncbi:DUF7535 family protein [Natrinema versiforme]|uniref:Uncharacterized protein n=1 Tax=Natrinema versiforme JCM 10478 TaxID=1227496 RepID=L9XZW7_9EURY|nr:hypothetical protein [Natrinema versiforme]ELY66976.1 hypothetical protein C489_12072 [Natrinema versiforme JCM 10478]